MLRVVEDLGGGSALVPNLATSIDTPDEKTYVVHLRPNVNFSDGQPMTAEDVVYSLNRIADPKSGSYFGSFASNVTSITGTDPQTVTITMSKPDVTFYQMLGTPMGQVIEEDYATKAGTSLGSAQGGIVCTGPYAIADWRQGDSITLEAHDGWWNAESNPLLTREAKFTFIFNENTLASALTNGDVDGTYSVPAGAALTKLDQAADGTLYIGPSTAQFVLVPTQLNGEGALADVKVRQALAMAIDYAGIQSQILGATAGPLRAIVPPGTFGYARDTYQAAYDAFPDPQLDIEGAKQLLSETGNPNPKVTIAVPSSSETFVNTAEAIQSSAKEAGFDLVIETLSNADFYPLFSNADARAKYDAFLTDWFVDIPEPLELYLQIATPGSASDFGGYDNQEVKSLVDQAQGTSDDQKRAELVVQAQETITTDQVWLPLATTFGTLYLNDRLGGATSASPYSFYSPWLATVGGR